jgi:hypothetical protein
MEFVAKARALTAAVSATLSTWRGLARRFQTAKQRWLRIPPVPPTQLLPVGTMAYATAPAAVATIRTVRRAAILPAIRAQERWLAGRTATARAHAPPKPRFRALHSNATPPAPPVRAHAAAIQTAWASLAFKIRAEPSRTAACARTRVNANPATAWMAIAAMRRARILAAPAISPERSASVANFLQDSRTAHARRARDKAACAPAAARRPARLAATIRPKSVPMPRAAMARPAALRLATARAIARRARPAPAVASVATAAPATAAVRETGNAHRPSRIAMLRLAARKKPSANPAAVTASVRARIACSPRVARRRPMLAGGAGRSSARPATLAGHAVNSPVRVGCSSAPVAAATTAVGAATRPTTKGTCAASATMVTMAVLRARPRFV